MLTGIIASLLGAIGQAFNYAVTKDCQIKYGISGFNLLAALHGPAAYRALSGHGLLALL